MRVSKYVEINSRLNAIKRELETENLSQKVYCELIAIEMEEPIPFRPKIQGLLDDIKTSNIKISKLETEMAVIEQYLIKRIKKVNRKRR